MNNHKLGTLKVGGYLVTSLAPGFNEILLKGESSFQWVYKPRSHQLTAKSNTNHFFRLDINLTGPTTTFSYQLSEVEESLALKEIKSLNESK